MLLDEVLHRIELLACLPRVLKGTLPSYLARLEAIDLDAYAEGPLRYIEEWIEPLATTEASGGVELFAQVCRDLQDSHDLKQLARAYEGRQNTVQAWWSRCMDWFWGIAFGTARRTQAVQWAIWVLDTQLNEPVCLHAIAGFWAWSFQPIDSDSVENIRGIQATCSRLLGHDRLAARLIEQRLGLNPSCYASKSRLRESLRQSPLDRCLAQTQANVVMALAESLRFVDGRGSEHAAALLESWLGLDVNDFRDRETLFDALAACPLKDGCHSRTQANVLKSLSDSLVRVEGRGANHAAMLLESWLGLEPSHFKDNDLLRTALAASALKHVGDNMTCLNILRSLSGSLAYLEGRGARDAAMLLETWLELEPEDFRDRGRLADALAASPLKTVHHSTTWGNLLCSLSDVLQFVPGRGARERVILLEGWLGLQPEHYRDQETLRGILDLSPLRKIGNAQTCANVLSSLSNALAICDKRGDRDAVMLLETWFGLKPEDYRDGENLRKAMASSSLSNVEDTATRAITIERLSSHLLFSEGRGPRHAALLLESWLGLGPHDFSDSETLRKALAASPLSYVGDPNIWADVLASLSGILVCLDGRGPRDATLLLESWLGLTLGSYHDRSTLRDELLAGPLNGIESRGSQASVLVSLSSALCQMGSHGARDAALLLESWLGLDTTYYTDCGLLRGKLASSPFSEVSDVMTRANVIACLSTALSPLAGAGDQHATVLLEEWLGLDPEMYRDARSLRDALARGPLQHVSDPITWAFVIVSLSERLRSLGDERAQDASIIITSWLGLEIEDFKDNETLRKALTVSPLHLIGSPNHAAAVHCALARSISTGWQHGTDLARRLWEVVFDGIEPRDIPRVGPFARASLENLVTIGREYLLVLPPASDEAWRMCEAIAEWIETVRQRDLADPMKRFDFLKRIDELRDEFQRVGTAHIAAAEQRKHGEETERKTVIMLDWLELLENRSLIERPFAEASICPDGTDALTTLPSREWPYQDESWNTQLANRWRRCWYDEGRKNDHFTLPNAMASPLEARGRDELDEHQASRPKRPPSGEYSPTVRELSLPDTQTADRLKGLPSRLSQILPEGVLFLRTVFDSDGRLWWWVVRRTSIGVNTVASARSEPGAADRLEHATRLFDLAVERAWWRHRRLLAGGRVWTDDEEDAIPFLVEACRDLDWARRSPPESGWDSWRVTVQSVLARVRSEGALYTAELGEQLLRDCWWTANDDEAPHVASDDDTEDLDSAVADMCDWLIEKLEAADKPVEPLLEAFEASVNAAREMPRPLEHPSPAWQRAMELRRRAELEQATDAHVAALARELDLSASEKDSDVDWARTDLLCQPQGPLWSYPMSLLPMGGRPLADRVASISCVVSLGMRYFSEQRLADEMGIPRNVLSAQWLDRSERTHMEGLAGLEAMLQAITEDGGWQHYSLGDEPFAASRSLVGAALRDEARRFLVAVIGGHGDSVQAGVRLADGLWQGQTGDLASLDLMFLVACAVGRLSQSVFGSGERDVSGLYARLATCRAVIAARWPIADVEAAFFAATFIDEYLKATDRHGGLLPPFARARLLNKVRQRLTQPHAGSEQPLVSRHLAHTFELYGLG